MSYPSRFGILARKGRQISVVPAKAGTQCLVVFVEFHETIADAILREKRIKKWRRTWKLELIESHNRQWRDLYEELA